MLSNTAETPVPAAPLPRPNEAARSEPPAADPHVTIEVASDGTGATNDSGATAKPPGVSDPNDSYAGL